MERVLDWISRRAAGLTVPRTMAWARGLGWLLGSACRFRRREVLRRLGECLPEKTASERRHLADAMYRNLGLLLMEGIRAAHLDRDYFDRWVEIPPPLHDVVETALSRGHGAIILTAHIGNFEFLGMVAAFLGFPVTIIAKDLKPAAVNRFWIATRRRFGVEVLSRRNSYRECRQALKQGRSLGFMLDQNMKRGNGIFVDFFGRPACTSPGLAFLSAQSRAPVIPAFMLRRPDGGHRVLIRPLLEPPPNREDAAIREATQRYTSIIEGVIREYPEQWIWLHRRWRTQPAPGS